MYTFKFVWSFFVLSYFKEGLMNKIILGGGISGLICGVLDPSALILTNTIGGVAKTESIAPFMIHFSEKAMQFLNAIQCPYRLSVCKVGYYYKEKIHDILPVELAKEYYIKSRGREPEPSEYEEKKKREGDFLYLGVELEELIDCMVGIIEMKRTRIKLCQIEGISFERREVRTDKGKYSFHNDLISTLPAHIFFSVINRRDIEFLARGKRFEERTTSEYDIKDYDYVYFPEQKIKELRITHQLSGKYTHEYTWRPLVDEKEEGGVVSYAYILEPKKIPKVKGVEFVGRYAEWDDGLLIHDIIERLMK